MPALYPFKAIHPVDGMIESVVSKLTDFGNDEEIIKELKANPHSYLHLTKLHLIEPGLSDNPKVFQRESRRFLERLIEQGVLTVSKEEGFFIYRQTINGTSHTGLIGLCDMEDYQQNHIKRHEYTRHGREEFISALISSTSVIGEPILLSHHHKQSLEDLLRLQIQQPPDFNFEKRGRYHQIWRIVDKDVTKKLQVEMNDIQDFYIMDGHHRIESINSLYLKYKSTSHRYALSFVLDSNQLSIEPFHRIVSAEHIGDEGLLTLLEENFEVTKAEDYILHPAHQRSFILKNSSGTYILRSRKSWGGLDVDLFEEKILRVVFEIKDSRTDNRLRFLAGDDHLNDALEEIKSPNKHLFLLHPCTFQEIARTSDAHQVLPPKSTYVEPKCQPGLFIQPYGDRPLKGINP